MKHIGALICLVAIITSCNKPEPRTNKFSDPVHIKIADLQDRRLSDSLFQFFTSDNASYRRDAALAFASIQDTTAVERLGELLIGEKDAGVRKAILYALGQTGPSKATTEIFTKYVERDREALLEALESLGKIAEAEPPDTISSKISPLYFLLDQNPDDSLVRNGKAWGMYRLGLRNVSIKNEQRDKLKLPSRASSYSDSLLMARTAPHLAKKFSASTRLAAAHTLSRARVKELTPYYSSLTEATKDNLPEVRMAAALALRKVKGDSIVNVLESIISTDADYRVRVNGVRALQAFPFEVTKNILVKSLDDKNINVGIAGSEVIKATLTEKFWNDLLQSARSAKNWRIQANLYEAVLAASDNKEVAEEVAAAAKNSDNPYQKAALITALQQSVLSYEFVQQQLFAADTPVVKSSAATALTSINKLKRFDPSLKKQFAAVYVKAIETGDPAVIGIIAEALADSTLGYKTTIKDFSFLYDAKNKLSLPKDNEALQPLEAAIAYFEGKKNSSVVKNNFNHPINWDIVKGIKADQLATIKTSKGDIIIKLLVEEAPGSVANFVELVNRKYFDNKFFHRVVPNFIIQAGCNRGDGWGSEDYSIRSEFSPRRYVTGSVGMASAGKDTEGTQWFITHSPTPHLDGRYTIFAEVESGMDVVHTIEVGDQIVSIELNK